MAFHRGYSCSRNIRNIILDHSTGFSQSYNSPHRLMCQWVWRGITCTQNTNFHHKDRHNLGICSSTPFSLGLCYHFQPSCEEKLKRIVAPVATIGNETRSYISIISLRCRLPAKACSCICLWKSLQLFLLRCDLSPSTGTAMKMNQTTIQSIRLTSKKQWPVLRWLS